LAALPNPASPNLPSPVSGAVDASRFSVTPSGLDVIVSWDLIGTGFTLGSVVLETDFVSTNPLARTISTMKISRWRRRALSWFTSSPVYSLKARPTISLSSARWASFMCRKRLILCGCC